MSEWLTREEAAAYARVSVRTIDRARRLGRLQSSKPSRKVLIRRADVDAWLLRFATVAAIVLLALLVSGWVGCLLGLDLARDVMQALGCPFA